MNPPNTKKYKIYNFMIQNNIKKIIGACSEAIAYVLVVSLVAMSRISEYIEDYGYEINTPVLLRLCIFGAIVSLIVTYIAIRGINLKSDWSEWDSKKYYGFGFIIIGSIYCIVGFLYAKISGREIAALVIAYAAYYFFSYSQIITKYVNNKYLINAFLPLIVGAALVLPIVTGKTINSEGYLSPSDLEVMRNNINFIVPQDDSWMKLNLDVEDSSFVELNIAKNNVSTNKIASHQYRFDKLKLEFKLDLAEGGISAVCLLAKYGNINNKIESLDDCFTSINSANKSEVQLRKVIAELDLIDRSFAVEIINKLNQRYVGNILIDKDQKIKDNLSIMMVRGAYFHHYNSIARSLNGFDGPSKIVDYFSNQYGFGPIFLVKIITVTTGLSHFDSIFTATLAANITVFILLLAFLYKNLGKRNTNIIWLGFSLSILGTYFLSNMMAPFLYNVRYLPTIFLIIFMLLGSELKSTIYPSSRFQKIVFTLLLCLIAIYNFEYAVLTCFGMMLGGIFIGNKFYFTSGLLTIGAAISAKVLFNDSNSIGTNYLGYLSGGGIGGFGIITYLFIMAIGIISFYLFCGHRNIIKSGRGGVIVASSIVFLLSAKVAWIGSANHIGPLFLLLAIIYSRLNTTANTKIIGYKLKLNYIFHGIYVVALVLAFLSWHDFKYNSKFTGVDYVQNKLSVIFKIPKALDEKLKSVDEVYRDGNLVLSPIDNAISLYLGRQISRPYPDVSTNINTFLDFSRVYKSYVTKIKGEIIVDRAIIENSAVGVQYTDVIISKLNMGSSYVKYQKNLDEMFKIYVMLKDAGYAECRGNEYYIVMCN